MANGKKPKEIISATTDAGTTISFLRAANASGNWQKVQSESQATEGIEGQGKAEKATPTYLRELNDHLNSVLTTPNLIVLAGSGTSRGKAGGPSMEDLWDNATKLVNFEDVSKVVRQPSSDKWIENLLSRCQLAKEFLDGTPSTKVTDFLSAAETMILEACTQFLPDADLEGHKTFLRRMARRRLRTPRLKIFTTNYDLCFEKAAGDLGIVVIDGFSFALPRRFDPRFFNYDVVKRAKGNDESHNFVEGVVHILKLHGSVNWDVTQQGITQSSTPTTPCLIFPMSTKYEQSYSQPHLELMAQFQSALREPNTCLLTIGFGFNDNHLSGPILAAVSSNPSFKLLAVDRSAKEKSESSSGAYRKLRELITSGEADITLLNAEFSQFAELIPQLHAFSPAEQIERSIKQIVKGS